MSRDFSDCPVQSSEGSRKARGNESDCRSLKPTKPYMQCRPDDAAYAKGFQGCPEAYVVLVRRAKFDEARFKGVSWWHCCSRQLTACQRPSARARRSPLAGARNCRLSILFVILGGRWAKLCFKPAVDKEWWGGPSLPAFACRPRRARR